MSLPYKNVFFDISGTCNAMCPWCDFGARRRGLLPLVPVQDKVKKPFTDPGFAEDILRYLLGRGFISQDAQICLYNWGEPLLNPNFEEILLIANRLSLKTAISTNGSIVFDFNSADAAKSVGTVFFSIPGYSQESYDYAHGFNAAVVRENIRKSITRLKNFGFGEKAGQIIVYSHIYRENFEEIPAVREFADSVGATFLPVFAHPNSLEYYLSDSISPEMRDRMQADLFFVSSEDALKYMPKGYQCPQWSYLTLSWNGKMNLCCCSSSEDSEIVSIKNVNPDESLQLRMNHPTCGICMEKGLHYLAHEHMSILRSMVDDGKMPEKMMQYFPKNGPHGENSRQRWKRRRREIIEKGLFAFLKKRIFPK